MAVAGSSESPPFLCAVTRDFTIVYLLKELWNLSNLEERLFPSLGTPRDLSLDFENDHVFTH